MAIIIPSKHIYSKNFDPVIDNQIDKIEVSAKNVREAYEYETPVYDADILFGTGSISFKQGTGVPFYKAVSIRQNGISYTAPLAIGNIIYDTYFSFDVAIPKKQIGKLIKKVYVGKRDGGESFIGMVKSWEKEKVYYNEIPNIFYPNPNNYYGYFNYDKLKNFNYTDIIEEKEISDITNRTVTFIAEMENYDDIGFIENWNVPQIETNENENIKTEGVLIDTYGIGLTGAITLNLPISESDLSEIKYKDENEKFVFYDIKLLFERDIYSVSSALFLHSKDTNAEEWEQNYPAKVIKCAQKVNQINLTIYGNTISLNIQDHTEAIGDGNKVFSFEGNELIQITNTPSVESKYQGIINKWKNGKQTAVISCPITDYYDENGNKVIDTSVSGKMLFKEEDVVIPYTYTNNGDKPLSYNKDFTPKQFKVVGTKITKTQGGMQELTLLEI